MVLSDVDIHRYIAEGKIKITPPLPAEQFGSCSVDFRLGHEFSIFEHSKHALIDIREKAAIQGLMRTILVPPGEPFILQPHEFALAITEKQDLVQALRFASAAAALKCTRFGGAFAAPQRAEVEELLSQDQAADSAQMRQK